jgi:transposase-like protein
MEEAWCYETLRRCRWPDGLDCPRCGGKRVTAHTRSRDTERTRYLCLHCRRTFTDLTGTPLARTNLPLRTWFLCLQLIGSGRTVVELARELDVKWDTADRIKRRLATGLSRPGLIRQLREMIEKGDEGGSRMMGIRNRSLRSRPGSAYGTVRKGKGSWSEGE